MAAVQVRLNPSSLANRSDWLVAPSRCTSAPLAAANCATSRPMVPGPSTSSRPPGGTAAPRTARMALPPGSTSAPRRASTVSGSGYRAQAGTGSCSASAPGQPPRMPIS